MRIGIDLDNTLADYSRPLERLCALHGLKGPHSDPKLALREELRARGREREWTRLQGELYGPLMKEAELFSGAAETVRCLRDSGCEVFVVSHRTRHPIVGEKHDLHDFGRRWLESQRLDLPAVFFEESKDAKIARIKSLGCGLFIDDLPEIFMHPGFPCSLRKILFDPGSSHRPLPGVETAVSWAEIKALVGS